LTGLD
jgi:hypothetical protein